VALCNKRIRETAVLVDLGSINWWAVLRATVVACVIGAVGTRRPTSR
jgi:hypothetical protein